MARATLPAALALLVLVPFSGCFDGGAKDFDLIDAPRWSAGHTWTYATTQSMSSSEEPDGDRELADATQVVLTVFNTSEPMNGVPVYYAQVSIDGQDTGYIDSPFFDGGVLAYTQEALRLVGRGDSYPLHSMKIEPSMAYVDSHPYRPAYPDPCEGRARIDAVEDGTAMPMPGFPMKSGTQRGSWSPDGDADFGFDYVMDVDGLSNVETQAGEFEAVHFSLAMSPSVRGTPEGLGSLRVMANYWYAPSAEQFVLMDLTATATGGFGGDYGSFLFESRAELVDFNLAEAAASPAPVLSDDAAVDYMPTHIVSDVALPMNAADGPVTARFALEDAPDGYHQESVKQAESFPPVAPYDTSKYHAVWYVLQSGARSNYDMYVGEILEYSFPTAGNQWIEVQLRPIECGLPWLGSSFAMVSNYWEKTWEVSVDPGLAQTVLVGKFPVEYFPHSSNVQWSMQDTALDGGHASLVDPSGYERVAREGTDVNSFFLEGEWQLLWNAYGREVTYGVKTPVVGDDVSVTLRIDYGNPTRMPHQLH